MEEREIRLVLQRVQAVWDLVAGRSALGDPAFQRHLAEGHLDSHRHDPRFIGSLRIPLERNLG